MGRQRLRTAMRRRGLRALQPKASAPRTTDSKHGLRCASNWLLDQPKPTQDNPVWVSDITHLPLFNGAWAYLCAFENLASKHVVGQHVTWYSCPKSWSPRPCSGASWPSHPRPGCSCIPTGAAQYCGNGYRALLHRHGAGRSQSCRGACHDKAQAGSLWSRLETEVLAPREWPVFADLADAQARVADYLDYYNHDRRHSSIGYQMPYSAHHQTLQLISGQGSRLQANTRQPHPKSASHEFMPG